MRLQQVYMFAILINGAVGFAADPKSPTMAGSNPGENKELVQGMKFHWCPPGKFTMGKKGSKSSDAAVEVTLTKGFWIGETEITQAQWSKVMESSPWKGKGEVKEAEEHAASYVDYDDAIAFCEKLTKAERAANRLPGDWKYTIPTEAQWEYACRAGTKTMFSYGDDPDELLDFGWYRQSIEGEEWAHSVGKKKPNKWGLADMHGNVREWCSDWFGEKLPGGKDPTGSKSGLVRIARGGSWHSFSISCQSSFREFATPDTKDSETGFRVVAVPVK